MLFSVGDVLRWAYNKVKAVAIIILEHHKDPALS